jgi:cysteinyl-tRNA synthetase
LNTRSLPTHQPAQIRLYNTLTRRLDVFEPLAPDYVGLYSCGPTVYDYPHVGNLRTYLFVDLLRRVLESAGFQVKHVMNITDVGHLTSDADEGADKVELGAKRQGRTAWDIAAFYTEAFQRDLTRLHIQVPHIWCKATDHIPEMLDLIRRIEERGFTYRTNDGIYFETALLPDYGKLALLNLSGQQAGARIGVNDEKRNPQDFALWKFSRPAEHRQMEWDSPWGIGFPGWHIECSAMSARYLGVPFDIHTGGIDHVPVHHTNEIAQTQAATGKLLAVWWLHGEFLDFKGQKMAKSAGGFTKLQDLIDGGIDPIAFRFWTYQAHYRTKLDFTDEAIAAAASGLKRLREAFARLPAEPAGTTPEATLERFMTALRDDLNAPRALAIVWETLRDERLTPEHRRAALLAMDQVLPMGLANASGSDHSHDDQMPAEVVALVSRRDTARATRDFATADAIRGELAALGFDVRDGSNGPIVVKR